MTTEEREIIEWWKNEMDAEIEEVAGGWMITMLENRPDGELFNCPWFYHDLGNLISDLNMLAFGF